MKSGNEIEKNPKIRIGHLSTILHDPGGPCCGVEAVIANLIKEQVDQQGHEVTLFASGTAKTKANLVSIYPNSLAQEGISWDKAWSWDLVNLVKAIIEWTNKDKIDILHVHSLESLVLPLIDLIEIPVVITIHDIQGILNNTDPGKRFIYENYSANSQANFVAVSKWAKESLNSAGVRPNIFNIIHNGIDIQEYSIGPNSRDRLGWIGNIQESKGVLDAISIAKTLGMRLDIAGPVTSENKSFFEEEIKPLLTEEIRCINKIEKEQKPDFFGNLIALLGTSKVPETFGMGLLEANAAGVPAVVYDHGAANEIVKNGLNGFLVPVNDTHEMCVKIKDISKIEREACRKWVEQNFTSKIMAYNYENLYYQILGGRGGNAK
jgi:glycosyltransferase involved in cell wall biosynthesis